MVKKVICTRVKSASIENIYSVDGNVVTFKPDTDWDVTPCSNATIQESSVNAGAAGYYTQQTLTISADIDAEKLQEFRTPHLFLLTISDGRTILFGSIDYPFRLKDFKHDGGLKDVSFICNTFDPQL